MLIIKLYSGFIKWPVNLSWASLFVLVCLILRPTPVVQAQQRDPKPPIYQNEEGRLMYTPDKQGNRIIDFSYAGYMAGGQPIPDVPIKIVVPVKKGDDTQRIQAALNYVASLPAHSNGIRGAVLLKKGRYEVSGSLTINASGVVLRGSDMGKDGTLLVGTGQSRKTFIRIAGKANRTLESEINITDAYVPVNAMSFHVEESHSLEQGDKILIQRPSTEAWIKKLGMIEFGGDETNWLGWKAGERDIYWDRTVTAVKGNTIFIDAPITTALDSTYGGGKLSVYHWPGRIHHVGVENLRLVSTYNKSNPKDESHRWMAITMENVRDAWVRQVVFKHFAGSAVFIRPSGKRITIQDSKSLDPVSEIGGQRRYTFWTMGQQTLFQRLYAEYGYHDFAVGYLATLNAFVQCTSYRPYSFSGAIDSWASGALFDIVNVKGGALRFFNRGLDGHGAGWTAANSVFWQCSAAKVACYEPPTADNWAFGTWAQFNGNGYWGSSNDHVEPRSLYYAQLADRLGEQVLKRANLLPIKTHSTSSPTIKEAAYWADQVTEPAPQLSAWIAKAPERDPIPTNVEGVKVLKQADVSEPDVERKADPMHVKNGWLVRGDRVLTGNMYDIRWWRGDVRPYAAEEATPHVTRFVPGRSGEGLTDSLKQVAQWMTNNNVMALEHNYGLWYDRRRDDHQRVRRMNGDVWAPFYELPFARSGQGIAWDGLSKYDLTEYNHWYWNRLQTFADIVDKKGLVLIHQNYFQHNILEAGAHWADFPWRTANNINRTGFPEPPPYAGDKRIFMAKLFYDTTHSVRKKIHKAYIRKSMSTFADNNGVIQFIGAEYTGPLSFTQFWLDTIQQWQKDTGDDAFVGLSVTKDVQDAIFKDARRSKIVDLIDIRYWHYRRDGSLYAQKGGQSLAPRQYARLVDPGKVSFEQVYRAVHEYRIKYPKKAVMYSAKGEREYAWAVFMAGGSLAAIPSIAASGFLSAASSMKPVDLPQEQWVLGNKQQEYIIYHESTGPLQIDLSSDKGRFEVYWIDPQDGSLLRVEKNIEAGGTIEIENPESTPVIAWINKI